MIALCFLFKNSGLGVVSTLLLIEKLSPHCSASCNKFSASSPPQRRSRLTLCDPMDCSTPGFPVLHYLLEFAQTHIIESVMPSNHLILGHYLFVLSSVFPNESALCIRWPKYWSFSISICPSSEYSGLISFRIDWFDLQSIGAGNGKPL